MRRRKMHSCNPTGSNIGIAQMPGFDESLLLLVERERYSLTDISMMFGVSVERMRQICQRRGIRHPDGEIIGLRAVRVWDDANNQFAPVSRGELGKHKRAATTAKNRADRHAGLMTRRAKIVATVADLRMRLNRDPSWFEMAVAVGAGTIAYNTAAPWLVSKWRGPGESTRDAIRGFRAATATKPRPRGGPGHLTGKCAHASVEAR